MTAGGVGPDTRDNPCLSRLGAYGVGREPKAGRASRRPGPLVERFEGTVSQLLAAAPELLAELRNLGDVEVELETVSAGAAEARSQTLWLYKAASSIPSTVRNHWPSLS